MKRFLIIACAGMLTACASHPGPYSPQVETVRDSRQAQALTLKAAAILDKDPARAESLLREALTADLYHGPAHNNLGVIYLRQGQLYSAASEFEWSKKLMPGHPDPRMNLALTLETAGRTDEALSAYASALETYEDHIPTMQAMTRLQIRSGRASDTTRAMLREISLKGDTAQWREWARVQLLKVVP